MQWGAPQIPPGYQAPPPAPYAAYAPYPAYAARGGTSAYAVLALVFGLVPVLMGSLGVIFGIIALQRIRLLGHTGRGLAIAGIVLGSLWLGVLTIGAFALIAAS